MAEELTQRLDLDDQSYQAPYPFPFNLLPLQEPIAHRTAVVSSMVYMHHTIRAANQHLARRYARTYTRFYCAAVIDGVSLGVLCV